MNDLNNAVFSGNLTKNPCFFVDSSQENRYIVCFSIAINQKYKEKRYVTFVPCVIFANQEYKEFLEENLKKGKRVYIQGEMRMHQREKLPMSYIQVNVNKLHILDINVSMDSDGRLHSVKSKETNEVKKPSLLRWWKK